MRIRYNFTLSQILFYFVIGISSSNAQQWCSPGAQWEYTAWQCFPKVVRCFYDGDTIINGYSSQIIRRAHRSIYMPQPGVIIAQPEVVSGNYYTRISGDSIFWWQFNTFQFIYDFNAVAGDVWTIYHPEPDISCPPEIVTIDSIGIESINGISMRWVAYTSDQIGAGGYSGRAYERFGPINRFIFPEYNFECNFAETCIHNFLCYSDNEIGSIGEPSNCEYYQNVSIEDISIGDEIKIYPMPSANELYINGDIQIVGSYSIWSMTGQKIQDGPLNGISNIVSLQLVPNGIYLIRIQDKNKLLTKKIIVSK